MPAAPWLKARARPPRKQLTRDAIVAAAFRVVDRSGLEGLSMRSVAASLGTGAASLYWHVRNREELLHLMMDVVAGEVRLPARPATWQEGLKELGREMRRAFLRHRDLAKATMGRIPMGPNVLRVSEWTLALLRGGGVPDPVVALAVDLMSLYVGAFVAEESEGGIISPIGEQTDLHELIAMYHGYFKSLPPEIFPNTVSLADELVKAGVDERFEFGMNTIVAGLASTIPPRRRRPSGRRS